MSIIYKQYTLVPLGLFLVFTLPEMPDRDIPTISERDAGGSSVSTEIRAYANSGGDSVSSGGSVRTGDASASVSVETVTDGGASESISITATTSAGGTVKVATSSEAGGLGVSVSASATSAPSSAQAPADAGSIKSYEFKPYKIEAAEIRGGEAADEMRSSAPVAETPRRRAYRIKKMLKDFIQTYVQPFFFFWN